MNARQATALGHHIAGLAESGAPKRAYEQLAPVLAERTPFRLLCRVGEPVGAVSLPAANVFLRLVAAERTEGGWVVIGTVLGQQLGRDPAGAFARCRAFTIAADVWYGADILGERVPGPALVASFPASLSLLAPWREDESRWVRRMVGVAAHFWAKRSRGSADLSEGAGALLTFLEPMFEEWNMAAVKGVGWGLKTLGRHYPDLMVEWLPRQLDRRHRALMLRKALTYLSAEQRALATMGRS